MSFLFQTRDVPVAATTFVRNLLAEGRGGCVYGTPGSGKSHAVRVALEGVAGGLRVDVMDGPLLGLRFMADVARQLGRNGRLILEAVRREGVRAALILADRAINGRALVVDESQILLPAPESLEDPAITLWQEEKAAVLAWLRERIERTPTFLVAQRHIPDIAKSHRHKAPADWPIFLKKTPDSPRTWARLGNLVGGNPAVLTLARALVPWLSAHDFADLVAQAQADEVDAREVLRRLGEAFRSSAPPSWQIVLALLAAVGETPHEALKAALDAPAVSALGPLSALSLVEDRPAGLSVLRALIDAAAIRPLAAQERAELLPIVAHRLLESINDLHSLEPDHADRVLRAHAIFVDLGDVASAEHTAALHVYGLLDLARRASLEKHYNKAWQEYDGLWRMLRSGSFGAVGDTGRHLSSYVRHCRAWNGQQAGALDDAVCLAEYKESLRQWPENALWHQRTIEGLIRLGHIVEAREALADAYRHVPEHPRRDELLRVCPARAAIRAGEEMLSQELLQPVLNPATELYPGMAEERFELRRHWSHSWPGDGDARRWDRHHSLVDALERHSGLDHAREHWLAGSGEGGAPGSARSARRVIFPGEALESRRILILKVERTIHDLNRGFAAGMLDLWRPFRPHVVWPSSAQALLVESILLRLPLLPIHVVEARDGKMRIIDGLQRLSSLFRFLEGKLALTGLRLLPELEGKRFADLPIRLRRRYEDMSLTMMVLGADADPALVAEVFDRMNAWAPLRDDEVPEGGGVECSLR